MQIKSARGGFARLTLARWICEPFLTVGWFSLALLLATVSLGCGGTSTSAVGRAGNSKIQLWVADTKNNRVLGYQVPPKNGDPAVVVLGQTAFGPTACNSGGLTATALCGPLGAAIDAAGNLWVADTGNNRVLEFTPPFQNGEVAKLVIGEPNFTTAGACSPSTTGLCAPRSLVFDQHGNLWVADTNNNRVLEFVPPFFLDMPATLVLGQANLLSSVCADAPPLPNGMCAPSGLAFDSKGNLFVSDTKNSRVLMFTPPFAISMSATLAIGQLNLTSNITMPTTQSSLNSPGGLAIDGSNNIYVADSGNARIMIFPPPTTSGESASTVLGSNSFVIINLNHCGPVIDGGTLCNPLDVKVDGAGNVVVADQNNRTLIFEPPITTGELASVVLGQPSLTTKLAPTGLATSQNDPGGLAVSGAIIAP